LSAGLSFWNWSWSVEEGGGFVADLRVVGFVVIILWHVVVKVPTIL